MGYSFVSDNFDINSISNSILSIQVSLDGFSFLVSPFNKPHNPEYINVTKIERGNSGHLLKALYSFTDLDLKEFYAIRIIVHERTFALVPEPIFDLRDMKAYLQLNHLQNIKSKAISNRISLAGAISVFSMNLALYELLRKKYRDADFCHTSLPFCNMALERSGDGCFIQIYGNSMELAVVKDRKLQLYNIFDIHDENDMVYFVLNAYKSCGLDTLVNPLLISGMTSENAYFKELAGKYIKEISFYKPAYGKLPENWDKQVPSHFYLNHREILNCAL